MQDGSVKVAPLDLPQTCAIREAKTSMQQALATIIICDKIHLSVHIMCHQRGQNLMSCDMVWCIITLPTSDEGEP